MKIKNPYLESLAGHLENLFWLENHEVEGIGVEYRPFFGRKEISLGQIYAQI